MIELANVWEFSQVQFEWEATIKNAHQQQLYQNYCLPHFLTLKSSVCIQMSTLENRWLWIEEYEKSNCYLVIWTKRKLKALKVLLEKWNRPHMLLSYKPNFMLRLYTVLPFKWKIKASCGQENKIYFPPILRETYEAILSRYFGNSNIPNLHKPCNL